MCRALVDSSELLVAAARPDVNGRLGECAPSELYPLSYRHGGYPNIDLHDFVVSCAPVVRQWVVEGLRPKSMRWRTSRSSSAWFLTYHLSSSSIASSLALIHLFASRDSICA